MSSLSPAPLWRGRGTWLIVASVVAASVLPTQAFADRSSFTLTASDGTPDAKFGISVAMSDDTLVVGAPDEDGTEDGEGAAYVFMRNGSAWTQTQRLAASDPIAGQKFGFAVAMSGDTLVIGGQREPSDPGPGAAYVFVRSGDVWTEQEKLASSGSANGDMFGIDVAVDGDVATVGASGAAYVFTRTGGSWVEEAKLTTSDNAPIGGSVSLSDDTVVVGAATAKVGLFPEQGAVYVFTRDEDGWTERARLVAEDGGPVENFADSTALSGNTLVVGAPFDDVGLTPKQGSVYVFRGSGATWTQQAKLTASDGSAGDMFGRSVAIDGRTVVVGAQWDDTFPLVDHGSAYVFRRSGRSWAEKEKLTPADPEGGLFGVSAALSDNTILVGAGFADVDGTKPARGTAYVFEGEAAAPPPPGDIVEETAAGTDTAAGGAASGRADDALPATGGSSSANVGFAFLASGLLAVYGARCRGPAS